MKKMIRLLALAIVMFGFAISTFAQVTASATATATIITPIAISKTTDMNFGNVAVSPTVAGTVILAPAGTRTTSGGVTLPAVTGTVAAAVFAVTGSGTSTYAITLPSTDYTITSGGNTMIVNTFTSTPSGTGALTAGAQTLNVGATLNVSAAQAAGTYTNATGFDVIVNYN
jgi:hypothetical protein